MKSIKRFAAQFLAGCLAGLVIGGGLSAAIHFLKHGVA